MSTASSASLAFDKYGTGLGFVPCFTFPTTRSFRVDLGTLNNLAARFTGIPCSTSTQRPQSHLTTAFLVGVQKTAGADFTTFSGSHDEL